MMDMFIVFVGFSLMTLFFILTNTPVEKETEGISEEQWETVVRDEH